ncbi:hypothetical protein ACTA71_004632 [Dictyostelium dimigraforme]
MDMLNQNFLKLAIDTERNSKIKLENEELFFKVWRNVYIRNKCIFYHLRNFNIAIKNKKHCFDSLKEYPLRNYLKILKISKVDDSLIGSHIPNKIIPNSVETLIINENLLISKGDLPDSIHTLIFGQRFKECISNDILPKDLLKLKLGHHTKLSPNFILPSNLKILSLERKFQLSLLDQVTSSLEFLSIEECELNTKIPKTIKHLGFSGDFHNHLPTIPKNIKFLYVGNKFNKSIDFLKLGHLTTLKIGRSKKFSTLYEFSLFLKQIIYLKVYMAHVFEYFFDFSSLQILNVNDKIVDVVYGFVDIREVC